MSVQDNLNCLKNLMRLMCCDGNIHAKEKAFLCKAAGELSVAVPDWNGLCKEVLKDTAPFYPIESREKAVAALKALIVMAKADGQVDEKEKRFAQQFAKTIGVSKSEWKQILRDIDADSLFTPFQQQAGGELIAISDDFKKLDAFLQVGRDNQATIQALALKAYLPAADNHTGIVCFHAAPEKDASVARCELLLNAATDGLVCILTRYQGHQVKYLHEVGLTHCVIEPVYSRDISDIFKNKVVNG